MYIFWICSLKHSSETFEQVINHVSKGDDSRSPVSSMAAVSLGSWFPSLGQRSSSCGPSPLLPLFLPLTQQMWSDHHGEGLTTSGSDYSQTIQLYQLHPLCWALLYSFFQRWCVTHSQLTNTGFTGWFIQYLSHQNGVISCWSSILVWI